MKNTNYNSTISSTLQDNATATTSKRKLSFIKKTSLLILLVSIFVSTTSCTRNSGTGCGAMEVAKYKKGNNAYSTYRGFN